MNPKLRSFHRKGKSKDRFFFCDTMRVKHISLIRIVNKSSKFNIGLSEFVIVLFYG